MIELFFEKNAAIDDWQDDSYGFFTPAGWCLIGISFTGWGWYKNHDTGKWKRRDTKEYWHLGLILLNIGIGIWYHEKEG